MRRRLRALRRANLTRQISAVGGFLPPFVLAVIAIGLSSRSTVVAVLVLVVAVLGGLWAENSVDQSAVRRQTLGAHHLSLVVRSGLRDLLLIVFAAVTSLRGDPADPGPRFWLVVTAAFTMTAVRLLHGWFRVQIRELRKRTLTWRNLEVSGVVRTARVAPNVLRVVPQYLAYAMAVVAVAFAAVLLGAPELLLTVLVGVAVLGGLVVLVLDGLDLRATRRETGPEETRDAVAATLEALAPEVVFYYSRPERTGYIANVWTKTLEQLDRRVLIVVREDYNRSRISTGVLPIVQVTNTGDLERVLPASVKIALYPSNVARNNHLIRLPGIVDVFIGHGDSDKGGSATTLSRIYDEIWVSGPAAQDRYRVARVGVRDEQIRQIGRPQLQEISAVAAEDVVPDPAHPYTFTVLYAPTREGFYAEWEYSSILSQGKTILRSLFDVPGVRVLFKPHPGTGTDDPRFKRAVRKLTSLVREQGAPHQVVGVKQSLYGAFNDADLLVSDVSSVITDFVASNKPYVVTNSGVLSAEDFRLTYPSAGGAYVLSGDGSDLPTYVEDAREADSLHDERVRCAAHLLGSTDEEPIARFDRAIGEAVSRALSWARSS